MKGVIINLASLRDTSLERGQTADVLHSC